MSKRECPLCDDDDGHICTHTCRMQYLNHTCRMQYLYHTRGIVPLEHTWLAGYTCGQITACECTPGLTTTVPYHAQHGPQHGAAARTARAAARGCSTHSTGPQHAQHGATACTACGGGLWHKLCVPVGSLSLLMG